jgi:gamma-glutamylcyclotransferase
MDIRHAGGVGPTRLVACGIMSSVRKRYFAYGSNIDDLVVEGRHVRCLAVAYLDDYRLAFTRRSVKTGSGVADVVASAGEAVWGVLYDLEPSDVAVLDRKEGAGWAYVRRPVRVDTIDGAAVNAFLYTVLHKESQEVPPSNAYLSRLIQGARRRGLPDPYLRKLERLQAAP